VRISVASSQESQSRRGRSGRVTVAAGGLHEEKVLLTHVVQTNLLDMYKLLRIVAGVREALLYGVPTIAMPYDWYVRMFTFYLLSDRVVEVLFLFWLLNHSY
jgi:hypothetical protein